MQREKGLGGKQLREIDGRSKDWFSGGVGVLGGDEPDNQVVGRLGGVEVDEARWGSVVGDGVGRGGR